MTTLNSRNQTEYYCQLNDDDGTLLGQIEMLVDLAVSQNQVGVDSNERVGKLKEHSLSVHGPTLSPSPCTCMYVFLFAYHISIVIAIIVLFVFHSTMELWAEKNNEK